MNKKQRIKINENQLKRIVAESVRKYLNESFGRKKKNNNYDDASEALNQVDSIENANKHLEDWCEEQYKRYSGPEWGDYAIEKLIKPALLNAIKAAQGGKNITTKNNATHYAWLVAHARFAMRLAKRYGIDLHDEWSRVSRVNQ